MSERHLDNFAREVGALGCAALVVACSSSSQPFGLHVVGAYSTEQLERMNQEFTAAVERAFRVGGESEMAATATYDLRRR